MSTIAKVRARQILDSRGQPTVEVDVALDSGAFGRAAVPAGASTGRFEARELRDGEEPWGGRGVSRAVDNVNGEIADAIRGRDAGDQAGLDAALVALDGSVGLARLGANAVLGVSLAVVRAAAADAGEPLWRHLGGDAAQVLPVPMMNVLNGGLHADNRLAVQEFMLVPAGAISFTEAVRMGAETYHELAHLLRSRHLHSGLGDEGGFAPALDSADQALDLLLAAIAAAGYRAGEDIWLALDPAATAFEDGETYRLDPGAEPLSAGELIAYWADLCDRYPIIALEDGLAEEDWPGWRELTRRLGHRGQLIGDDVFVTHVNRLRLGAEQGVANAILIKPNQVGTLTQTLETIGAARDLGYATVMSHRSGETEDTIIADLAVATGSGQIKTGAPARSERVAKYNRLLRIEEALGSRAEYAGLDALRPAARA